MRPRRPQNDDRQTLNDGTGRHSPSFAQFRPVRPPDGAVSPGTNWIRHRGTRGQLLIPSVMNKASYPSYLTPTEAGREISRLLGGAISAWECQHRHLTRLTPIRLPAPAMREYFRVMQDFYSIADIRRLAADLSRETTIERRAKSREIRLSNKTPRRRARV
jgi:hypothetical protein